MRISKLFVLLCLTVALGQEENKIILARPVKAVDDTLIQALHQASVFGASYILSSVTEDSLVYERLTQRVVVDTFIFSNTAIGYRTQRRLFRDLNDLYSLDALDREFRAVIDRHSFLGKTSTILVGRLSDETLAADIQIQPRFSNTFSGFISTGQENGKIKVNGELTINLENTWGTANHISLFWKQPNPNSRLLHFLYEEPYPFGAPIGLSFRFDQELRNEAFITARTRLDGIFSVKGGFRFNMGVVRARLMATETGEQLGITPMKESLLTAGILFQRQDDRWLPRRARIFSLDIRAGEQRTPEKVKTIKLDTRAGVTIPLPYGLVAGMNTRYYFRTSSNGNIPASDYVYYGGSNTLRGYREDLYHSSDLILLSGELGFHFTNARIFTFLDMGINRVTKDRNRGVGVGFAQITNATLISLSYGISDIKMPGSGKIHIRLENRL